MGQRVDISLPMATLWECLENQETAEKESRGCGGGGGGGGEG